MSLYLAVFDGDEDVLGVDVGLYSDFGAFRDEVCSRLEPEGPGSRFPVLMTHSDCDGAWETGQLAALAGELAEIKDAFLKFPPERYAAEWQANLAKQLGLIPKSLLDSFIDVDGEPLVDRLIEIVAFARAHNLPILFQ